MSQLSPDSENANRFQIVSRLADDLAHEIKNPLNSMVISLELLRTRARKGDAEGVLERADVLESEVRRLNGLVDGLLKLLRPERAHGGVVAIDPVLEEIGGLIGVQAKLARKDLTVTPIGDDAVTHGQRDAIRFALLNLLAAELDAVTSEAGTVALDGSTDADAITIRILTVTGAVAQEAEARREAALAMARSLLQPAGGVIEAEERVESERKERVLTVRLQAARA
jgi:signal transduction histidine kinase